MAAKRTRTGPETARAAIESTTGFRLQRAHALLRQTMVGALDGSGINLGQVAILGALSAADGLTQRQLSDITGIEKSSMVLFLDALEAHGWVDRRQQPGDRRAYAIHLTGTGAERLAQLGPKLDAAQNAFFGKLSARERHALHDVLGRLLEPGA
jgi:DNA-binding MarR family transcriptional regulator